MEPNFIDVDLAITLHDRSVSLYGGLHGLRDRGALESAVAQAVASFGGEYLHPTVFDQAAAYLYHIAKNHPFLDGNKRTALASALVFLEMNGYVVPSEANDDAETLTWLVAEGRIEKPEIAAFFHQFFAPPDLLPHEVKLAWKRARARIHQGRTTPDGP